MKLGVGDVTGFIPQDVLEHHISRRLGRQPDGLLRPMRSTETDGRVLHFSSRFTHRSINMKLLLSLLTATLAALSAHAVTFTVTTNLDAGPGSLRQAILDANAAAGDDTITFDPALNGQPIRLTSGQLVANGNVSILGPGQNQLAIDGNGTNRVFYFSISTTNLIAGLTITNGSARRAVAKRFGGGIFNDRAVLMVSNVTLVGNSAQLGGGIYSDGQFGTAALSLQNTTIISNSADNGGGIYSGITTLTIQECALNGNSASLAGH